MPSLEKLLSPLINNKDIISQTLDKSDITLIERIRIYKTDLVSHHTNFPKSDLVRPEIAESWLRSHNYGLDQFNYNFGPIMDKYELKELTSRKNLLLEAADLYIHKLEALLVNSECVILLSDEKGVMLRVVDGDHEVLVQQNKRFHLVPGSIWTEETVGTCAHGLSLLLGLPIQIGGPEHFSETYDQISCSSAPIFDANGNLAGTLSIVSPYLHGQNSHSLGLVVSTAWDIQSEFRLALHRELLGAALEASDEAIILISKKGLITRANLPARKLFGYQDSTGEKIEEVLGCQPLIQSVLVNGKPVYDAEIYIEKFDRRLQLRCAKPLNDRYGNNYGCVLTLKEIDRNRDKRSHSRSPETRFTFDKIVGNAPPLLKSIDLAKKFSHLDGNILIQGETGTGKEMFAQAIHNESRPHGPFIAVNCAAIPKTLIESELFGYERGAFTSAEHRGRKGKIELADGGTLFLDEIGDMPLELQPVLLRVLEAKTVMRLGGCRYIPVDFQLVAATNKDLLEMVKCGQFRDDLYYRLAAFKITIPPLRERGPDIIGLAQYFINNIASKRQIPVPQLSDAAILHLLQYDWPGNVRQLENAMLYAVSTSDDGIIKPENLPDEVTKSAPPPLQGLVPDSVSGYRPGDNSLTLRDMEKITIMQALIKSGYNISRAAKTLEMSRSTLYRKIKKINILNDLRLKT